MNVFYCQGRQVTAAQLQWLEAWMRAHPDWSRKRLARELCVCWEWRNERGRLKDFAARSFLLKLEARGWIQLPALQTQKRRDPHAVERPPSWTEPPPWVAELKALQPVQLRVVRPGTEEAKRWAFYLDCYHYLGLRRVGENMGYLASDRQGRELACLLFGAPAWRCLKEGDQLPRIANNTRFLVLPWVRVPHLASHVLAQAARRLPADWQAKYGHGLDWLETFVDPQRYEGICYEAANWRYVGQTTGRSRQDRDHRRQVSRKSVYLYPLSR